MSPAAFLYTAGLLGLMALAGGGYGGLYTVSRLQVAAGLKYLAFASYGVALLLAALITVSTPLTPGWKILVMVSALVYAGVPPMTWRFLVKMHAPQEQHP